MKTQESTYRHFNRLIRNVEQGKNRAKSKSKKNLKRKGTGWTNLIRR